jgi:hypothetical protein
MDRRSCVMRNGLGGSVARLLPFLSLNRPVGKEIIPLALVAPVVVEKLYRADNLDFITSPIVAVDDDFEVDVERYCSISRRSICFTAAR